MLYRFAGGMAGGEGYLQVVAAGVGIEVEQLADDIQAADEAALHGLGVHLGQRHAALGHHGFVPVVGAGKGKGYPFQPVAQAAALLTGELVKAFIIFYM